MTPSPLSSTGSLPQLDFSWSQQAQVDEFSDLFNFDDAALSGGESSNSPNTISPNHTPSPLLLPTNHQSPVTYNADNTFGLDPENMDFGFDFPLVEKPQPAVAPIADVQVKQEPGDEFSSAAPASVPQPSQLDSLNLAGLPADQQAALQQLMTNIMTYQQRFGSDVTAPQSSQPTRQQSQQPQQRQPSAVPTTIEPSMVFANSGPSSVSASSSTYISPLPPISESQQSIETDQQEEERLVSISPYEQPLAGPSRSSRGDSIASDIDHKIDALTPLPNIFSLGKGKGGKKGGGMSSVVRGEDEELDDDDSWRPSPEEYKKLSSKEKRQLRNKLSARAFRNRRKDYIGTLESHIRDRDSVIDQIRDELVTQRSENQDLRRELEALKRSTMSILHPESANSSAPSPALLNAFTTGATLPAVPSTPIKRSSTPVSVNTRKDLPATLGEASRSGFWGGADSNMLGFGGGSTICHTMFTPELNLPSSSSSSSSSAATLPFNLPRQNLNPRLNEPSSSPSSFPHLANPGPSGKDISATSFSEWSEQHPFSLRSMDTYRIQMWSRLAREAAAEKQNIPVELRPKFFVSPETSANDKKQEMASAGAIALAAAGHISNRLGQSFWSALSAPGGNKLDTDKLAAVVTGKAKLAVVDARHNKSWKEEEEEMLAMAMGGLKLQSGLGLGAATSIGGPNRSARCDPLGVLGSWLKCGGVMAHA